jgi:hypothetical protein
MMDWPCGHDREKRFIHNFSLNPIGKADLQDQEANGRTNRKMGLSKQDCEVRRWTEIVQNSVHIQYSFTGLPNDSFPSVQRSDDELERVRREAKAA